MDDSRYDAEKVLAQRAVPGSMDLREMLRTYVVQRALDDMRAAEERRLAAAASGDIAGYGAELRAALRGLYDDMPVGPNAEPPQVTKVSRFDKTGYRIENVLFDSFPGYPVNASVYVPLDWAPPHPAVVIPVGHSGKQFDNYQLPAQFFARAGYVAVLFDPPGQASEKQPGNDHFKDGIRCYMVGHTSSRYFIGDALRCIDYLQTREDVNMSNGVGMTGVSGGGTTTSFATLLDDRIAVSGPSCCLSRLSEVDIGYCYAGCPETHQFGRYALGLDETDLVCAAVPTPTLLMQGDQDALYYIDDVRVLADIVRTFFEKADAGDRFEFFVDNAPHSYSLNMARAFTRFLNKWLLAEPSRAMPDLPDDAFTLDPYDELKCRPRTDVNMRTLSVDEATRLKASWHTDSDSVRAAAQSLTGTKRDTALPQSVEGRPFRFGNAQWQPVQLTPEPGIALPGTLITPVAGADTSIVHFDDRGRHDKLEKGGWLSSLLHAIGGGTPEADLFTVDLRGWGDTEISMYPHEMHDWGGRDRYLAYATAALGDSIMAMRIRDGLAALRYVRASHGADKARTVVFGSGLGAIVALHVAALAPDVDGVVSVDGLWSFAATSHIM